MYNPAQQRSLFQLFYLFITKFDLQKKPFPKGFVLKTKTNKIRPDALGEIAGSNYEESIYYLVKKATWKIPFT